MYKYKSYYLILLAILAFSCSGIANNNGYMPVLEDIESLSLKKTTTQNAKNILGEPALIMGSKKPVFVYFSQATRELFFFETKIMERNLLVLRFDGRKRLRKIEKFSLSDGKDFDLSKSETSLNEEEKSIIRSFFSNVGLGGVRVN